MERRKTTLPARVSRVKPTSKGGWRYNLISLRRQRREEAVSSMIAVATADRTGGFSDAVEVV
jgi:hypothetical protein